MKLIIQIPCFNEEETLAIALADLPRNLPGIDQVEWLVIDDGSTDHTYEVATAHGVDHIVRHPTNLGLARAFMTGLTTALKAGADIIVNTDADNQYCADDIPKLIEPILNHRAEIVVGARPITTISHFSPTKKMLQKLGSWIVRWVSRTQVHDAPSGFRAFSRSAASRLVVFDNYTYTLETIIQAGRQGMAVESVPIRTNACLRPSRLIRSIRVYIKRSILTILRISFIYSPGRFFANLCAASIFLSFIFGLWFLWHFVKNQEDTHIPTLIITLAFLGSGLIFAVLAVLADLLAINRRLLEDVRRRLVELESAYAENSSSPSTPSPPAEKVSAEK
jgi:glycosyltransferase involved in cell wall biosynthesis